MDATPAHCQERNRRIHLFSIIVPDEWQVFTSIYDGVYVIKDGTSQDDYGSKPSIVLYYKDEDAYTSCVTSRMYNEDATDLSVNICGTDCFAISYKEEMASKPVYWTHTKIFMPVSDSASASIDLITDSSEFEGVDILDDDVRQIIVSLQRSF